MLYPKCKLVLTVAICFFVLLLTHSTTFAQSEQKIKLKAAAMAPKEVANMQCFARWVEEVEKRTNGQVEIDVYWGASLLDAEDAYDGTGKGLADIVMDVPSYHPSKTPFMTVTQLGYMTRKVDAAAKAVNELYKENKIFKKQFEDDNIKIMSFVPFAPNIMGSKEPITKLEDLQGKKIRALGILNDVVAKLGATPVAIPAPELYEALNRGIIEGFTGFPLNSVHGFKLEEVTTNFLDFGYGTYLVMMIGFNMDKWEALPDDVKKTIKDVNKDSIDMFMETYAKLEPKNIEPLKDVSNFHVLSDEEMQRWKAKIVPEMWKNWIEKNKKYGPSEKFFNKYKKLVNKYEKESTYKNPFPGVE